MDLGLDDRVVVVGGASRGIGLATARAFLAEGARVAMVARDDADLQRAAGGLGDDERVLAVAADLVVPGEADRVVGAVLERWGAVDCAVANVGAGSGQTGWAAGDEEWERLFAVNLLSARRLAQAVVPGMLDSGRGSIAFVASIVGVEAVAAPLAYSAAKSALLSYATNLSRELGPGGVRVNAVAPGNVLFEGGTWERKLAEDRGRFEAYVRAEVPLQRFGTPEEIADAVVFLCSERASFITGATLVADGGQTRRIAL